MTAAEVRKRLFVWYGSEGVRYADRGREIGGDYAPLAFLSWADLVLTVESDCPQALREEIERDAATYQARVGEEQEISAAGQAVRLGHALPYVAAVVRSPGFGFPCDGA